MYKSILLHCCFVWLGIVGLTAQPVLSVSQLSLDENDIGTVVTVDISVANYESIASTQFSVNWNANVIQFAGLDNLGALNLVESEHFGLTPGDINAGKLRFAWFAQDVSGVTLADGTILFSMKFMVNGSYGAYTSIAITNDPIAIEVTNSDLQILNVTLENGEVAIGIVDTEHITDQNLTTLKNIPNPFSDFTRIAFTLKSAEMVKLRIYDSVGKLVHTQSEHFNTGEHAFLITGDLLPATGVYSYKIETTTAYFSKKLIFVQ